VENVYVYLLNCIKILVSTNPCPCGYYPDRNRCSCSPFAIRNYINRVSQALLDRIDLCVETAEVGFSEMHKKEESESSAVIRKRVERVHRIQRERYAGLGYCFNSQITGADMDRFCHLDAACERRMAQKYEEYGFSARTYNRTLKLARTLADMDGAGNIRWEHLEEAIFLRSPDKKYWG